jgi:response regulator RpfG family c-di-GMP phosphodiesterase
MANPAIRMDPATIVVVDDDPVALAVLEDIIGGMPATTAVAFGDPAEALGWCQACTPDVILTDYQMPGMDGLALLERLRAEQHLVHVPIMVVTALNDREVRCRALGMGANDYLTKPLDPTEAAARIHNMVLVHQAQQGLEIRSHELALQVRLATAGLMEREREVILRLGRAAEYRDWESSAHTVRVAHYSRAIAEGCGLTEAEQERIFLTAPMHDVGKIGIPDRILLKAGRLEPAEFEIMKQHTLIGHRILADSKSELLQYAAVIARSHHERIDGTGYPDGLRGEAIPLCSQIVAVADIFDAMTSRRPYQPACTTDQAVTYLRRCSGRVLDRTCVEAFLRALPAMLETRERFRDAA